MSPFVTSPAALRPSRMPDLPRTRAHLEQGLGKNFWSGFSLAVRKNSISRALAGGDVPDPKASVPWFSAGKPVTAAGILKVVEYSPLELGQPIAATLPELAGSYAGTLTLEAILSHQTGLRVAETELRGSAQAVRDFFRRIHPADCKLSPGQAAYDPAGGWWLLGQWLERRAGKPWADFFGKGHSSPRGNHRAQVRASRGADS